jgi:hypothetical protein
VPGYQLERLLGLGATGEVWLGRQPGRGTAPTAIKTLACDDAESRDRLRREGRLLARLDHPHIVPLLDVVDCAAGVALVMEYAAGGSLAELLGQRRLTAGQLVHLAAPLADALAYAHSCGVVHADVSPANVLFTDDGRPLLADFGLAALTGPLRGRAALAGTPDYLDPDLADGADPDARADIYALGVICWEALAGQRPHAAATPLEVLDRAARADRTPLARLAPDAPAALGAVIDTALARRREGRYSDAAELAAALRAVAVAEPVPMLPRLVPVPVTAPARPTRDFGPPRPRPVSDVSRAPHGRSRLDLGPWTGPGGVRVAVLLLLAAVLGGSAAAVARRGWADAPAPTPRAPTVVPSVPTAPTPAPAARTTTAPAGPAAPTATPAPTVTPAPTLDPSARWSAVLAALDDRRAAAYAAADPDLLRAVYSPGAALTLERERVAGLAAAGERIVGLRPRYTALRVTTATPARVTLALTDVLPAYRRLDARGSVVEQYAGRGPAGWSLTLRRVGAEWRIESVTATE